MLNKDDTFLLSVVANMLLSVALINVYMNYKELKTKCKKNE